MPAKKPSALLPTRKKSSPFDRFQKKSSPFDRFHRRSRRSIPWLQTLVLAILTPIFGFFFALGRLKITGRENIPDGGYIVVANHPSNYDPIFVAFAIRRRIRFMGKSEFFKGTLGAIFSRLGAFPVQRGVWDAEAFETSETVLKKGQVFAMFPEGGVVEGTGKGTRGVAKAGLGYVATRSGARILPVQVVNTRSIAQWWKFPRVEVHIGEVIEGQYIEDATREQQLHIAQTAVDAIYALSPA